MDDLALLRLLGRRGRHAVVQALAAGPGPRPLQELAQHAGVHPVVAGRAVRELEAVGAAESARSGRTLVVRFRVDSVAGAWLASLRIPDLLAQAAHRFADAYRVRGVRLVRWREPAEDPGDPGTPCRIALLCRDADAAMDGVGPALDAVRDAGLPVPDVLAVPRDLVSDDPVSHAVLAGDPI